ncbi:MAG: hypothetical protein NTV98_04660 [Candidatus Roizmanbacteria bacterium]|nr:hypothetical protein [Candidatus Roizmanbacteria bacterium]
MNIIKPIHLRNDEFNNYIQEFKEKCVLNEGEVTPEEKGIVYRCGVEYGLTIDEKFQAKSFDYPLQDYNIIFRIKGPFTLPREARFSSDHGMVKVRPYIIQEYISAQRLHMIAQELYDKEIVSSVVPIDKEYLYEALRETAFNISMEEVVKLGVGFQIVQIEFDENGHFKAVELDESHY